MDHLSGTAPTMNVLQRVARRIIEIAFDRSVGAISLFHDMSRYHQKVDALRTCRRGSLGSEIANVLDRRGLTLVPGYESHDLKHALLDFDMTAEGEIRMQAFMVGNGNYSVPSLAILLFGAALLPDLWTTLVTDFGMGRRTRPVSTWTIERYASQSLTALRDALASSEAADVGQEAAGPRGVFAGRGGPLRSPPGRPGRVTTASRRLNRAV